MTSVYRAPVINNQSAAAVDSGFYCDIRFDPDDAAPDYVGMHLETSANTADTKWKVLKFTKGGSGNTRIQTAYGAWDNRASLF